MAPLEGSQIYSKRIRCFNKLFASEISTIGLINSRSSCTDVSLLNNCIRKVQFFRFSSNIFVTRFLVTRMCSRKKVLLNISQDSQENTCIRVLFLIWLQAETLAYLSSFEFCKKFKSTFFRHNSNKETLNLYIHVFIYIQILYLQFLVY